MIESSVSGVGLFSNIEKSSEVAIAELSVFCVGFLGQFRDN